MNKLILQIFSLLIFSISSATFCQLSGSINVGSGQTYTTLTGAGGFFAAVNSVGLSGNVTVAITSNITEDGANALNQWTESGGSGYTININSSSATERVLSGSVSNAMIRLNGADRVTFDGRVSGSGQYLRFRNTNSAYPVFQLTNDATNNTITYCIVESNNRSTSSAQAGAILFGTSTGSTGNDNNTISYCDIRDRSDATGYPTYSIASFGTSNAVSNGSISILNNNIYNFWRDSSSAAGIYVTTGTGNDWNISGNSFYQTASRTINLTLTGWQCIWINNSACNNFTISNNFIGGSSPNCGGSAWTVSGSYNPYFYGMRLGVGTATAASVNGNTIANFNFTYNSNASNNLSFVGIVVTSGLANVGTSSANTVGNTSSTGNIAITFNSPSSSNNYFRGIEHRGTGSVSNNNIGSFTFSGTASGTMYFEGINFSGVPSADISISGNTVGSSSTGNSIQMTSSGVSMIMRGIYSTVRNVVLTMNSNTIANFNNLSNHTSATVAGILQNDSAFVSASNNVVSALSTASTNTTISPITCAVIGIGLYTSKIGNLVTGNTVSNLNCTGNSTTYVQGIGVHNRNGGGVVSRNRIYDLRNTSTSGTPRIWGINSYWGNWNYYNNQVTLTNGEATDNSVPNKSGIVGQESPVLTHLNVNDNNILPENTQTILSAVNSETIVNEKPYTNYETDASTNNALIEGIHEEDEIGALYYYNSVYIGGSASSGSSYSAAFSRPLTAYPTPVTLRNNIFFNARTNSGSATGKHYSVINTISPPTLNWSSTASNYNIFVSSNANTIGEWGSGVDRTIDQWRTSSGGDIQTWSTTSSVINASNLFTSISTGNLNINSGNTEAWLVHGKGIAISGQNTDYSGNARSTAITGGTTDIGSNELSSAPPSCPLATENGTPGSGVTTSYTLWARTICSIEWGIGGTSYPSTVNVRYYSGVNPNNVLGGNYSNSYWEITPGSGTLTGTTYNVTINFGDNETYTITSPSTNTRLAKKETTTWEVFSSAGTGAYQTELNWAGFWAKTIQLSTFSDYALTDPTNPLPVTLEYFNASVNTRTVNLEWKTTQEINNSGFSIERRMLNSANQYTEWRAISFVTGKGTTNEATIYKYKDDKMNVGTYQYRLKQIDFNANFEYFNLTTPDHVTISNPFVFDVSQNYPNPSNPKSKIDFQIPNDGRVVVKVYDISGREVKTLMDDVKTTGFYTVEFDGSDISSGVYFYKISIGSFSQTKKMILVK